MTRLLARDKEEKKEEEEEGKGLPDRTRKRRKLPPAVGELYYTSIRDSLGSSRAEKRKRVLSRWWFRVGIEQMQKLNSLLLFSALVQERCGREKSRVKQKKTTKERCLPAAPEELFLGRSAYTSG